MRKRLPLAVAPATQSSHAAAPRIVPVRLGSYTVGVADTGNGLEAVAFALELTSALAARGASPSWVLTDFESAPSLPEPAAAALSSLQVAVTSVRVRAGVGLPLDASRLQLWIGLPAISALQPAMRILLGADVPKLTWPSVLRTVPEPLELVLGANRPGLATALAEAFHERGFLPQSAQVVR